MQSQELRDTSLPLTSQPLTFSKFCEEKLTRIGERKWQDYSNVEKRVLWLEDHIAHLSGIIYDLMDADSAMSVRWKQFLEVTMAPALYYNVRNDLKIITK